MTNEQIHDMVNAAQVEGVMILFLAVAFIIVLSVVAVSFLLTIQFVINPDFIHFQNKRIENVFADTIIQDNNLSKKKVYNALFHATKTQ